MGTRNPEQKGSRVELRLGTVGSLLGCQPSKNKVAALCGNPNPQGPSAHYLRPNLKGSGFIGLRGTMGPFRVPKTMKKVYLDP